jgi:16S rRNA (cytosine967-C5)-methyltransferase
MPISPARVAAFDILLRVEQEDSYASELLHSSRCDKLSPGDHGLATEMVMGVLRWRSLLDEQIAERSSQKLTRLDPEVITALRLAAYQLLFLDRVPERAAVHESVELVKRAKKRSAVPFANAVLRKLAGEARKQNRVAEIAEAGDSQELAAKASHPPWLVERWIGQFGFETARQICIYNQKVPETAIRVDEAVAVELQEYNIQLAPGSLLTSARRVLEGDVTSTPAFREGRVMTQDEASQLIALLIGKGVSILDCCAAPGGKTRVLAQQNPVANIVAVELHPHRARLLRRLTTATNVQVIAADMRNLPFTTLFDCVIADVPCSGTGTLARNPEIKWRLKLEDIADLQRRQLEILQSAMQRVRSGGRLVYSTCSLEAEENSEIVEKALSTNHSFRLLDCADELQRLRSQGELHGEDAGSLTAGPYLRTVPGAYPCDGFFAAILQKS